MSDEPTVNPDRFLGPGQRSAGGWALGPSEWPTPEEELLSGETHGVILEAIEQLSDAQRTVITMRDLEGVPAEEVAEALGITDGNQRVLLHRARAKVRASLESYFGAIEPNLAPVESE